MQVIILNLRWDIRTQEGTDQCLTYQTSRSLFCLFMPLSVKIRRETHKPLMSKVFAFVQHGWVTGQ